MKTVFLKFVSCVCIISLLPARPVSAFDTAPGFFYAPGINMDREYSARIDEKTLIYAVNNARAYGAQNARAGVVPHHLTAASLIAGFFSAVSAGDECYDAVVVIGPDHYGAGGDITVTDADWEYGVACDAALIAAIAGIRLKDGAIHFNDAVLDDHAAGALVPFINYYLPGAKIAPVLINKSLSYADVLTFAAALSEIINSSEKNILLLCSVDFSHYLAPDDARVKDAETLAAMGRRDYKKIYGFTDAHADCRAALIVFLYFLNVNGLELTVLDHTDASAFTGPCIDETTTYFILVGNRLEKFYNTGADCIK